jgi:hypothetical protein
MSRWLTTSRWPTTRFSICATTAARAAARASTAFRSSLVAAASRLVIRGVL